MFFYENARLKSSKTTHLKRTIPMMIGVVGAAQPMVVVVYGQAPQNRMSALSSDTSSPALLGYALLGAMVLFAVAALLLGGLLFLRLRAVTQ